ncbi:hypothetical protein C8J56DRAFT_1168894 [Mycena floridula]|nr:hypothetical protein C8J56DRAFT_1168894 [Mycena floridula]
MNDRIDIELAQGRAVTHQGAGYPSDSEPDVHDTSSNAHRSSPLNSLTPSRTNSPVSTSPKKICLDSSSDEESKIPGADKMTTAYHRDKKYATLSQQGSNKPCEVSDGIILPALLHDFDRKQANYCDQKDIAVADRVRKSLSCFMENKDADHEIDNQREELEKLEWKPFIARMKEMVLQDGWEKSTLTQLMNTKMKKGQTFRLYSTEMVFVNRLLEGTPQHQDDSQLRTIVTAGVPDVLRPHAFEIVAANYGVWSSTLVAKIKKNDELGELLAASNAHVAAVVVPVSNSNQIPLQPPFQYHSNNSHNFQNEYQQNRYQPNSSNDSRYHPNVSNDARYPDNQRYHDSRYPDHRYDSRRSQNNHAAAHTRDMANMNTALKRYPPKLMQSEIFWLDLYNGCRGCRRFDIPMGHRAINCDTPDHLKASGDNYQPITERTALNQGRVYVPNHGLPNERSPLQRSLSAPPNKRPRPTASIVQQQQVPQQVQLDGQGRAMAAPNRRVSGPRRVSSEGGRGRRAAWIDSDDDEWRPNVSMPSAVLHKEFDEEDDSEEDELRSDALESERFTKGCESKDYLKGCLKNDRDANLSVPKEV